MMKQNLNHLQCKSMHVYFEVSSILFNFYRSVVQKAQAHYCICIFWCIERTLAEHLQYNKAVEELLLEDTQKEILYFSWCVINSFVVIHFFTEFNLWNVRALAADAQRSVD